MHRLSPDGPPSLRPDERERGSPVVRAMTSPDRAAGLPTAARRDRTSANAPGHGTANPDSRP